MPSLQRSSKRTESWTHLYLDGAVKFDLGYVAVGGVIREDQGRWILGFNRRISVVMYSQAVVRSRILGA
ncbi:hypothetical protein J1N35_000447 [Gossypium stocksii]|uniref:RNase H type-1 domain-containing protein n=1 Tax=Gossypium stocksii TaxID=47602 RepID=A0A9D3WGV5_9ROSI|nr:hypothetical protein J1N35_000447 [Gossypium stocksii]